MARQLAILSALFLTACSWTGPMSDADVVKHAQFCQKYGLVVIVYPDAKHRVAKEECAL